MAYSFWYLLKSNIQTHVTDVVSETLEDVVNFDNSTYRDGPYTIDGVTQSFPYNTYVSDDGGTSFTSAGKLTIAVPAQTVATTAAFTTVTPAATTQVVSDDALKIPPRFHTKTRSRYIWKDVNGETVGSAWLDELVATSPNSFAFVS